MPRTLPQRDLDQPCAEWHGDSRAVGPAPHQLPVATLAGFVELQRLLAAANAQNRHLVAHVRQLQTELCQSSAELAKLRGDLRSAMRDALTDPLTGLANRRSFDLELEAVVGRAGRWSPVHLVMADVDHFKRINDAHGHGIGDQVLRIVGELLRANVRHDSVVARVGGDEFALLLPVAGPHYAAGIVGRLRGLFAARPLVMRNQPEVIERLTLSVGVADWRAGESSAQWRARADAALYEAKRHGRDRVVRDAPPSTAPRQRGLDRNGPAWAAERSEAACHGWAGETDRG